MLEDTTGVETTLPPVGGNKTGKDRTLVELELELTCAAELAALCETTEDWALEDWALEDWSLEDWTLED